MRRRVPAISCLAIAFVASACASVGPFADREVRVLVYNIHAGWDASGKENLDRVAEVVRTARADVVLLQEVDRFTTRSGRVDQVARLTSATGLRAAFGKTLDYQGGAYGIAILSRWPITRDSLYHLPVSPPQQRAGGSYEPRGVLHAVIRSPRGDVHVFNTHLDASADDHYRMQEARTATQLAEAAKASGRVLIGGDLNATPESRVLSLFRSRGWIDPWSVCARGNAEGRTYPAHDPVRRIDYLLADTRWGCREALVLESDASDHRPLLYVLSDVR
jgi:endonuclease/exonuclease/phosphatase family metal-dependent hydrolase